MGKRFFTVFGFLFVAFVLGGCSTNPATGKSQFAPFMSPQQELQIGAQMHAEAVKRDGLYKDEKLQAYLNEIGKKVSQYTERTDIAYKFYLLDTPQVNAFALPGGYIYMTRGIMALANSEAEFAAVLGHEVAHVTARHGAERYSRRVMTGLGREIISIAVGQPGVSEVLGLGDQLYTASYSRGQESEADSLGIRYMNRSGYQPGAAASFFNNMLLHEALEMKKAKNKNSRTPNFLATHPATAERIHETRAETAKFAGQGVENRERYLRMIDGMTFGDSADQGFVKGRNFYHPQIGFMFTIPEGAKLSNGTSQVRVSFESDRGDMVFDFVKNDRGYSPYQYLKDVWAADYSGEVVVENVTVDGMRAAMTSLKGVSNDKQVEQRYFAIAWEDQRIARFVVELPQNAARGDAIAMRDSVYSFRRLSLKERETLKPYRIKIITSAYGDSAASLGKKMALPKFKEEEFRVLNGLGPRDEIVPNRLYKIVVD